MEKQFPALSVRRKGQLSKSHLYDPSQPETVPMEIRIRQEVLIPVVLIEKNSVSLASLSEQHTRGSHE